MKRLPCILVVDNIRSLYNIGSIFRTADGVLLEAIRLGGISGCPPNRQIEKTALGATKTVPYRHDVDIVDKVKYFKKSGRKIYALELTDKSKNYTEIQFKFPCVLIVGNEVDGVSDKVMKLVDEAVDISMMGRANSLNVATAFAVIAYEMLRQWKIKNNCTK